jgi:hypothetical protein
VTTACANDVTNTATSSNLEVAVSNSARPFRLNSSTAQADNEFSNE